MCLFLMMLMFSLMNHYIWIFNNIILVILSTSILLLLIIGICEKLISLKFMGLDLFIMSKINQNGTSCISENVGRI